MEYSAPIESCAPTKRRRAIAARSNTIPPMQHFGGTAGRLRHYSLQSIDIAQAASDYQKALSINPRLGEAWADLSDCFDQMGRYEESRRPRLKKLLPFAGIRLKSAGRPATSIFAGEICPKCMNASGWPASTILKSWTSRWIFPGRSILIMKEILQKLIPDTLVANLKYLNFLVARG